MKGQLEFAKTNRFKLVNFLFRILDWVNNLHLIIFLANFKGSLFPIIRLNFC